MGKIDMGYTASSTVRSIEMEEMKFEDFGLKESEGGVCVIVNTTSPLDRQEEVRFNAYPIDDIYKGTSVQAMYQNSDKRGVRVVSNVHETWKVTPSESGEEVPEYQLPVSAQLTIAVPLCEHITSDDILKLGIRALNGMLPAGDTASSTRVASLVRGALVPAGIS